jgi:small subunit ribosomal protein S3Ae
MSIADRRIQSSQEEGMRAIISETLTNMGKEMTLSEIVKAIISGNLSRDLAKACHVIIPIKRIEVRKSEVLEFGEGEPEAVFTADEMVGAEPAKEAPVETPAEESPAEEAAEAPAEEASE